MGKLEDLLWRLSPMGQIESLLSATVDIIDSAANGELPKAADVISVVTVDGGGEGGEVGTDACAGSNADEGQSSTKP